MDFQQQKKRRMRIMLIGVGILFGCIFIYKGFQGLMLKWYLASNVSPVIEVSATKAEYSAWQPQLSATGSLRAIRGVNVTTEVTGMVNTIYFTPGTFVTKDTVLVQLNADSDNAALHALQASANLAKITYYRDLSQYSIQAVSKQTLDTDSANLKNLEAQVAQQAALVLKKTIRAPFDGRLGISVVNPGQFLNPGDMISTLQTLDPIYADFYMPQQALAALREGQVVNVTTDTFPGRTFTGKITTINPAVEVNTRNVQVEATLDNPTHELIPGMFARITVVTGAAERQLTLPQAAISFNPYGEFIYLIHPAGEDKKGKPILKVGQAVVVTGESRGDQIAILQGLKEGEQVVTSGQLKLKNGSLVAINNKVVPSNNPQPLLPDER